MKKNKKTNTISVEGELKNQLARALADYDNLQKRVIAEREEIIKISNLKLAVKMLSVCDMLEEAQKHLKDSGIAMTLKEFENIFSEEGITKIPVEKGSEFDENLHEAVEIVDGEKSGTIADVVMTGWKYADGKIIRPVKVKVFRKEKN